MSLHYRIPPILLKKMMTSRDLIRMAAMRKISPWGNERADMQSANIAYWSYVAMQGNEDGETPVDFIPDIEYFIKALYGNNKQTPEQMEAICRAIAGQ